MAEITTKNITCETGLPAFIAIPADTSRPLPAIVIMHERYGLVQHTLDLATRFAQEGFVCIAPDCFFRHPDQDALHAGDARYDITDDEAAEHLGTAIDVLEGMAEVDNDCIAVKGVCQTGRQPPPGDLPPPRRGVKRAPRGFVQRSQRREHAEDCAESMGQRPTGERLREQKEAWRVADEAPCHRLEDEHGSDTCGTPHNQKRCVV